MLNFFLKFQQVDLGKQVKNQLVPRQNLLVTDEWTSVKIFTGSDRDAKLQRVKHFRLLSDFISLQQNLSSISETWRTFVTQNIKVRTVYLHYIVIFYC